MTLSRSFLVSPRHILLFPAFLPEADNILWLNTGLQRVFFDCVLISDHRGRGVLVGILVNRAVGMASDLLRIVRTDVDT